MENLQLYLHIPFCEKKCDYCDFLSGPSNLAQRDIYVDALCEEINLHKELGKNVEISSIFFGGGTPSILNAEQISKIMQTIRQVFLAINKAAEITVEVNPGTVNKEKLKCYHQLGIHRLSIGLQATNNEELRKLGRIHTYETFLETYSMARELGFENINIDLMSAIPGQTIESWGESLDKIIALKPEHISAYSLIIEEDTPYNDIYGEEKEKAKELPPEEEEREMYYLTQKSLKAAGYERYEVSNYAKDSYACRHNLGYWNRTPYLGLGIGAASLLVDTNKGEKRTTNIREINSYMACINQGKYPWEGEEYLSKKESMEEYMFLGLRKKNGISISEFEEKYHTTVENVYGTVVEGLKTKELLKVEKDNMFLTEKGIDLSNMVLSEFLL